MRFLTLAALILLAACQAPPPAEMTDAERSEIEAAVIQVAEGWFTSWASADADGIQAIFDNERFVYVSGGTRLDSPDAVASFLQDWYEDRSWEGGWDEIAIDVLSPDAAAFSATFHMRVTYTDGRVFDWPGTGSATAVFERRNSEWKATLMHISSGTSTLVEEAG
ncbi:YybH family protein [Gemmatimonadota bacterium]